MARKSSIIDEEGNEDFVFWQTEDLNTKNKIELLINKLNCYLFN